MDILSDDEDDQTGGAVILAVFDSLLALFPPISFPWKKPTPLSLSLSLLKCSSPFQWCPPSLSTLTPLNHIFFIHTTPTHPTYSYLGFFLDSEMSQNRSFQDGSQHESTMDSAFTRLEQGLMMTPESEIQLVIEPFLEPLVLKIIQQLEDGNSNNKTSEDEVSALKKVVEVMVIQRVHHVIEPIMEHLLRKVAKVVIESVVDKVLTRKSGNEMHSSEPRVLQLRFQNKLSLTIWTGMPIKGEDCLPVKVALVDGLTGEVVNSGLDALAKVEIVVLRGDFDDDEGQDWTLEEFNRNIVREREGNKPLLSGNACLNLREGIGFVGEISFTHTKIWMNNRKFRLGARIVDNFNRTRVREAKTEPFIIKDRRGKLYKKLDSPSLSDEVWRLKNIDRRGAFYKRLRDGNIKTVQQFLTEFFLHRQRLQVTLGTHMSDKMLKETVDHALTNKLDDWYSYYSGSSQQKFGVVFNVGGQVLGILSECRYVPVEKLSATQKVDAHKLVVSAFEHWGEVVSVDRNSLSCDSSNLSNAPHSNSPILENPINHNNGTYHMINGCDSIQPCTSSLGISSPNYFNRSVSSPDDFGISDMDFMSSLLCSPPYYFSKSMIQEREEECPQFCSDHCNTQAVIPGIESHTDQQSDKSDTGLVGDQAVKDQKIWLKTFLVLRFQRRIRIVNSTLKRQRCS